MIGFLQRVRRASVDVADERVGAIADGLLVLVGIRREDDAAAAERLAHRLLAYRVFADGRGRMYRSLGDTGGGLLLVPQFTLCADTRRGLRPGFEPAAPPERARGLFEELVRVAEAAHDGPVASGRFGADMQVALINDGPVSFWLEA